MTWARNKLALYFSPEILRLPVKIAAVSYLYKEVAQARRAGSKTYSGLCAKLASY